MRGRALRISLAFVVATAGLSACAPAGASYRTVAGFAVTSPHGDDEVLLPLRLEWADPAGSAAYLVFVDRAPVKVGGRLTDVVTSACRRTPGCPDADWYTRSGVIMATERSATILAWPAARGRRVHHVTVVRMDATGRRVGEVAAALELLSPKVAS